MCTNGRDPQLGQLRLRWGLGGHWSLVTGVITPDAAPLIINIAGPGYIVIRTLLNMHIIAETLVSSS